MIQKKRVRKPLDKRKSRIISQHFPGLGGRGSTHSVRFTGAVPELKNTSRERLSRIHPTQLVLSGDAEEKEGESTARKSAVEEAAISQVAHLSREGSLWAAVTAGRLEEVKLRAEGFDWNERGTFGETVLHVAALFKHMEIAKFLAVKFPPLMDADYLKEEYKGETVLHIAVIHGDLDMVRFLLEQGCDPNKPRATGNFFRADTGTVYYGEHAVAFAVCTEQPEMVRLLCDFGANLDVTDAEGNTLFHHVVRMDSPTLFDTCLELAGHLADGINDLNLLRNHTGFTPLQFAAHLGKLDIFEHILERMKQTCWEWGDVSFCAYPIHEVDTHGDNTHSVLETIITEQRSDFMTNAVVYEVLSEKWASYGRYTFTVWFILHFMYCMLISTSFLAWPFGRVANWDMYPLWILGTVAVMTSKVVVVTVLEIWELTLLAEEHGLKRAWHIYFERGTENSAPVTVIFKMSSWASNLCTLVAFGMMTLNWLSFLRGVMVLVLIFEWLQTLMFAQALRSTGRLVLTITKILVHDVARFGFIYLVFLSSFSCGLLLLSDKLEHTRSGVDVLYEWLTQMFVLYEISLGLGGFSSFEPHLRRSGADLVMGHVIYVVFLLFSVVLLFNLLIAVMTETTEAVREKATEQWLMQWASTVLLIERRVPSCWYKRTGVSGQQFGFKGQQGDDYFITFTQVKQRSTQHRMKLFRESVVVDVAP